MAITLGGAAEILGVTETRAAAWKEVIRYGGGDPKSTLTEALWIFEIGRCPRTG